MFSMVTSAFFSISRTISSPRGDFRLSVSDFLLALNWWKYHGSLSGARGPCSRRPGSPTEGFSILTTSAPSQASDSVHEGPASNWVKSTILTPARQSTSTPSSVISSPSQKIADRVARLGSARHRAASLLSEAKVDERVEAVGGKQQRRVNQARAGQAELTR